MRIAFIIIWSWFSLAAGAQDFKRQYRQAKDLFASEKYAEAMDAFRALTVYDKNNPYPEYASFFYAVSAHRMGFVSVAKDMFLQIRKLYPQWDQLNEVNYWLAKIYFDQGEVFQGMLTASQIQQSDFANDIQGLKKSALAKLTDTETLKMLLEEYPYDSEVAKALALALSKQEFPNQELTLLDSIITAFHLRKEDYEISQANAVLKKDRYRVALLFPFLASTLEPTPNRKKNQVVLDLYEGMKLAADTLAGHGINIDLLAYDTERSADQIQKLLQEEELKGVDLMVGPIYAEGQNLIQDFSARNHINLVVNPLSNNSDPLAKSPYAILYQPSHETLGIKSAEFLAEKATKKNCLVYYDESPKDSAMAFNFIKRALELGIKVEMAEEVRKETSGRILTTLASATEYDEFKNPTQFKLKKDSIGSIFVASDDALIYTKVINAVETRGDSVLVIGQEGWLEDVTVDLRKFERIKVGFASPNFASSATENYQAFRKEYLKKHAVLPSDNAKVGYEFIMTMGRILYQYGSNFQPYLMQAGQQPGTLTRGFQLQPTRDNGMVPFTAFRNGELVIVKD